MKRKTTATEKKVFVYLNELRESGKTNMFGARPYIMKKFKMDDSEKAKMLLMLWMQNFDPSGTYEEITDKYQTA